MNYDIAIVGGGPSGLCLARSLSGQGLAVTVLERQPEATLARPAFDGREIALTHGSQALLARLDIWSRLDQQEVALLRDASVFNGPSPFALQINAEQAQADRLGHLVANHAIRQAAYESLMTAADTELRCETELKGISQLADAVELTLTSGEKLHTRLLVAADSRFSDTRRLLGIGAQLKDYGKSMLVCRMQHEADHQQTAWEWFGYGQTLALLPLNGRQSSVVLTLPASEIARLLCLDETDFATEMQDRFNHRLGRMQLVSSRHAYPLVGAYARRMIGQRSALIGDAAVGMHPVTAHGFNLGLGSVQRLSALILAAHARHQSLASPALLERYQRQQRLATWPLYQATNLLVGCYTSDQLPMRLLRNVGLRLAQQAQPLRRGIARHLTQPA